MAEGPQYRAVEGRIREIIAGLNPGDRLPTVARMVDEFDAKKSTVIRALAALQAAGIVETHGRSGTFVRQFRTIRRSSPARLAQEWWGAGRDIQDADTGEKTEATSVEVGEEPAPRWVADVLGVPEGDPVVYRDRVYVAGARPVMLARSYLPVDIARGTPITYTSTGKGGTYARLAEIGHAPTRFREWLRGRMPLPEEARRLKLAPGTPVLRVIRHAYEASGRAVEVNHMVFDADAYELDYSFEA